DAHVRFSGARGDVPLDLAHVVARHVRAHLRELRALAEDGRAVVAGEQPLHPPGDRDVERPQELPRDRPRARSVGARRTASDEIDRAQAALARARSTCGTGTAASTASRIFSASTSSASAWYESTSRCLNASRASDWTSSAIA